MKENVPNAQIQSKSTGYRYRFGRPRQEFHDSLFHIGYIGINDDNFIYSSSIQHGPWLLKDDLSYPTRT